jgi:choline kinase
MAQSRILGIVLAAGRGNRLNLAPSKALVMIHDRPMIYYATAQMDAIGANPIGVVINSMAAPPLASTLTSLPKHLTIELLTADTGSAFQSLRKGLMWSGNADVVIGCVDSIVPRKSIRQLSAIPGHATAVVAAGPTPLPGSHLYVHPASDQRVQGVTQYKSDSGALVTAGYLRIDHNAPALATEAAKKGVYTLRSFQNYLALVHTLYYREMPWVIDIDRLEDIPIAEAKVLKEW